MARNNSIFCVAVLIACISVQFLREDCARAEVPEVITAKCIDCHGEFEQEANLRLDSNLAALTGGDSGEPAIVPGESEKSYVIARVLHKNADQRMPPDSPPLNAEEVKQIRQWINESENWSAARKQLADKKVEHWSFQPVEKPLPPGDEPNPIDAFINAKLAVAGITPSTLAEKRVLVRRAYLVVLGLPPTPEQVDAFVNDDRENAWPLLVEELLASPHYGERMATPWLDLVRFGETNGYETNRERPHAWRYRDWVIDAFNNDKPYDAFIREQLAGDALGADVATSFLVAGPVDIVKGQDPKLSLMQRQDELADIVHTTGATFLGLTVGCARCHNHKFDPISQTDYYSLQAVFAGVKHADKALPFTKGEKLRLAEIDAAIASLETSLAKYLPPEDARLRPPVNARLNTEEFNETQARFVRFTIEATNQGEPCIDELEIFSGDANVALAEAGARATSGGDFVHPLHKLSHINDGQFGNARSWIAKQSTGGWVQIELPETTKINRIVWARDRQGKYNDRLATKYQIESSTDGAGWKLLASSADRSPFSNQAEPSKPPIDFESLSAAEAETASAGLQQWNELLEQRKKFANSKMAYAGSFSQPGATHRLYRGEPGMPREQVAPAAIASIAKLQLAFDSPEQQRRLAIADWIADKNNPLTARVMANRIWQFHFGSGIVATPSDFGANGTPPSHPQLLDWLAAELIENGWSLKHIHRQILLSQTWRRASFPDQQAMKIDAGSRLLWRFPPRRLSAEAVRDSTLAVAGTLRPSRGGPGFSAFEVSLENVRHYFPKKSYGPEDWRRMVYMTRVRQERDAVFGVFDCPDFNQVVPKRTRSTTPLQALNLLNSRFMQQQAELFAKRLHKERPADAARVKLAYELCFGRTPSPDEQSAALAFIESTSWKQFTRALLNSNEFVFIP